VASASLPPLPSTTSWHADGGAVARDPVRRALVAVGDVTRSATLAARLADAGFAPTLVFTPEQLAALEDLSSFDVVVLDDRIGNGCGPVDGVPLADPPATIVLSERVAPAGGHLGPPTLRLPPRASADEVVGCGRALVARGHTGVRVVEHGPLRLEPGSRRAWWHGRPLHLTPAQYRVLLTLADARGDVVDPVRLHHHVWGADPVDDGSRVKAHVKRLRGVLGEPRGAPRYLLTVRGEGYRLAAEPSPGPSS
jgi:DNA-binding response OmpR family regulator